MIYCGDLTYWITLSCEGKAEAAKRVSLREGRSVREREAVAGGVPVRLGGGVAGRGGAAVRRRRPGP
jgi:hypothetical protein